MNFLRTTPALPGLLVVFLIAGCGESGTDGVTAGNPRAGSEAAADQRWYSAQQVTAGGGIFAQYCSECHGDKAQGPAGDWRVRLDDGSFPPPPLNGGAHAWHHPLPVLLQVINEGGIPLGGKMPAFADVLDDEQKLAAIAYFQQFWSDEIYRQWRRMGGGN